MKNKKTVYACRDKFGGGVSVHLLPRCRRTSPVDGIELKFYSTHQDAIKHKSVFLTDQEAVDIIVGLGAALFHKFKRGPNI